MTARTHVCPVPGCPQLEPCPTHGRPANAPWSKRDKAEHARFARAVRAQADACQRCGSTHRLQAHHWPDGSGSLLCAVCHRAVDPHAR